MYLAHNRVEGYSLCEAQRIHPLFTAVFRSSGKAVNTEDRRDVRIVPTYPHPLSAV